MKILIYSDVHFSQDSSIVRSMGDKYSTRLEYLIKSLNWAEELAEKEHCVAVFNLGDTFDKSSLNAMEISALKEVRWSNLEHFVLVGNHDSNITSLEYSSADALSSIKKFHIVSSLSTLLLNDTMLYMLPYITEENRKSLKEYLDEAKEEDINIEKKVILSHNDIKGIQLGKYISQEGFSIDDISKNCDLFLNGHLHNSSYISKKILNVGNLSGQTFNEDSFKYSHGCWILDVDTLELTFYENPYALNFYKIEINEKYPSLTSFSFKNNAVLMIKCERKYQESLKKELEENKNIVASKIIIYDNELVTEEKQEVKLEKLDYLKTFNDFILDSLGNNDIIKEELSRICK